MWCWSFEHRVLKPRYAALELSVLEVRHRVLAFKHGVGNHIFRRGDGDGAFGEGHVGRSEGC
jgi:hypothetical protein